MELLCHLGFCDQGVPSGVLFGRCLCHKLTMLCGGLALGTAEFGIAVEFFQLGHPNFGVQRKERQAPVASLPTWYPLDLTISSRFSGVRSSLRNLSGPHYSPQPKWWFLFAIKFALKRVFSANYCRCLHLAAIWKNWKKVSFTRYFVGYR